MRTADPNKKFFRVFKLSAPNGANWFKIEGRPTGKRERYYFGTEREAKKNASHRNAQIVVSFGSQNVLPDADRVLAAECIRRLAAHKAKLTDAVNFYIEHLLRLESSITVNELCDRVLVEFTRRAEKAEVSKGHLTMMKDTVRRLRAAFGNRNIKTLDGNEVKDWLAGTDLAVKTRNNYLGYVMNVFGRAQEWNLIDTDIFAKIEKFRNPLENALQVTILTPDDVQALLNAVETEFLPLFALNVFTGLRREEITKLDWSEVKLDRNLIDLPAEKSKNHRRKLIEVPANLLAWLQPFARTEGPVVSRSNGIEKAIKVAAKKAGIVWKKNWLRHSFASYAVALHGFEWTAKQADHSEGILKKHYREVVSREDAEKYWAIQP